MSTIKSLSRLGAVLASLAIIAVSLASSASASTSMFPEPNSNGGTGPVTPAPVSLGREETTCSEIPTPMPSSAA